MAALAPIAAIAAVAATGIGLVQTIAQAEARSDAARNQAEAVRRQQELAEEARQRALRRAVARRRAAFGAQGTGSADGSGEAVLLGLVDDTAFEDAADDAAAAARLRAIADAAEQQRIDLLGHARSLGSSLIRGLEGSLS
jgi:hypothetical protein